MSEELGEELENQVKQIISRKKADTEGELSKEEILGSVFKVFKDRLKIELKED